MKLKKDNLPKWLPLAGIAVAGLIVAFIGWKVVVAPQNSKATSLDAQAATVQQQIASNLAAVAQAHQVRQTVPQIKVAQVYKLAKAMPSTADVPDLLIELSQVTRDAGVDLQTLSPGQAATDPATGQTSVPVSLTVGGDFYTVTDLLYRLRTFVFVRAGALEATGRLFTIDGVNLSQSGTAGLVATISMHAFVYGASSAPAATPPAAPTDTSTDTTSTTTPDSGAPSAAGAP